MTMGEGDDDFNEREEREGTGLGNGMDAVVFTGTSWRTGRWFFGVRPSSRFEDLTQKFQNENFKMGPKFDRRCEGVFAFTMILLIERGQDVATTSCVFCAFMWNIRNKTKQNKTNKQTNKQTAPSST